jgi:Tfp pilus assembly protein PilN
LKRTRRKKVLGLALGERSLLAAEVIVAGDQPTVTAVGELVYPEGVSVATPEELAKALSQFLRDKGFTARQTMIGLPAKWLVVRPKDVPPADAATVTEMLRLAAESEFPTDIKDLVFDFTGTLGDHQSKSVLLMATPRKYVDAAVALCEAARLTAVGVTSSGVALGEVTGRVMSRDPLVLAVGSGGAEMTSQSGSASSAIRHLRAPDPQPAFASELRRALLTLANGKADRELILWDGAGLDAGHLGENLGVKVRSGDLPNLGVSTPATNANGEGRKYAAAVALGLAGIQGADDSVDFLHPRLAPPKQQRVPQWAMVAGLSVILVISLAIWAYADLQNQRTLLATNQAKYNAESGRLTVAEKFVDTVSFAQAWHGGNPRYLACMQDLTVAVPEDYLTYVTSIVIHEAPKPQVTATPTPSKTAKNPLNETRPLVVQVFGKTSDQDKVHTLLAQLQHVPTFSEVMLSNSNANVRERNWSFAITFTYTPPKGNP